MCDQNGSGLARLLAAWDHKHKHAHFPKPLPIFRAPIPAHGKAKRTKPRLFSSKSNALEKQAVQAYKMSRNMNLKTGVASNKFYATYRHFERTDHPGELTPREARKGRWNIIHGILQNLATLSVDTSHLCFKHNVSYSLNPRLKGPPPWELAKDHAFEETSPFDSHCWTVGREGPTSTGRAPQLELSIG